jgi:plastocyanin
MTARRTYGILAPTIAAVVVIVIALLVKTGVPGSTATRSPTAASGQAAAQSGHASVQISNYGYAPDDITVKVGTKITWTNHDPTAHTATANNNTSFNTGTINPHQSRTVTFTKVGTYPYHCVFHAFMTGTVTVVQ